ncbi:hypothetical protein FKW77_005080 [Venturia effusa]|uniref:Pyrrolo-quinoline quinone repeat domain-containing protein n=1 Tax=Venturia effusa TaxID=50376 RepID=A0A517KZF6_9PEZI|nr:hypothetical protein FKW77_005080 [Venturia effusa]
MHIGVLAKSTISSNAEHFREAGSKLSFHPSNSQVSVLVLFINAALGRKNNGSSHEGLSWDGHGGGPANRRFAIGDDKINSANIHTLREHCRLTYPGGLTSTPTTYRAERMAYFPTSNGLFVAVDYKSCETKWAINVTSIVLEYAPLTSDQQLTNSPMSRTSPQIADDVLFFGTQSHALIVAVDRHSGKTLGFVQVNPHHMAAITMSPIIFDIKDGSGNATIPVLFVGASSAEENAAALIPNYTCCSFVGNMVALTFDRASGFTKLWDTPVIPPAISGPGKWAGAGIWGSQPSVDLRHFDTIFVATGNTYSIPSELDHCQDNATATSADRLPSDIWQEAVIALEARTGKAKWVRQLSPLDAWNVACIGEGNPNCPETPGPDADFGMAPSYILGDSDYDRDVLVVGQKNGVLYSLDSQNGDVIWATETGPGGVIGGLSWGLAVDRERVYFTNINGDQVTWQIQPSNQTTNSSAYGAANLRNGALVWETIAKGPGQAYGPPSVVGDLVFTNQPSLFDFSTQSVVPSKGGIIALHSATGEVALEKELDAPFHLGLAIQDQCLIFGTGYKTFKPTGSFYVMCVD